jgi:hypothetical protein
MANTAPTYQVDDLIYLRSSAQIGFLESYRISQIVQRNKNEYLYKIDVVRKAPLEQAVGDRINLKSPATMVFSEDELLTYCDAQTLVVYFLERRLAQERARLIARCPTGSEGSG